ncbi:hypothetical protein TARUN_8765 [Trichoderma arundinaceum]|uniref:Uncharacterized protein n=1 Tax=Trichoderma arundinaceum TaxID=490622 RepID=A0A395NBJ6_TRIAR|nr:hypothetical protein TARUN_8765 [Trichoderma arundinaceum]
MYLSDTYTYGMDLSINYTPAAPLHSTNMTSLSPTTTDANKETILVASCLGGGMLLVTGLIVTMILLKKRARRRKLQEREGRYQLAADPSSQTSAQKHAISAGFSIQGDSGLCISVIQRNIRLVGERYLARGIDLLGIWSPTLASSLSTRKLPRIANFYFKATLLISMKDSGLPVPRWAPLAPAAAAPPILTFNEPPLELISRLSRTDSHDGPAPQLGQTTGEMCSPEGQWNCMTTSWQRCASGTWSAVIPCAVGTICQPSGLTDYITIEHELTADDHVNNDHADNGHADNGHADNGQADDIGAGNDREKNEKKGFGLKKSPSLALLFTAAVTGISWGFLV